MPMLALESLAAAPVDGGPDMGRTREPDAHPLRWVDRRRDRQCRVLPACALALDDSPGRCLDVGGESRGCPSREDEGHDRRASGQPRTIHPPKQFMAVVTPSAALFNLSRSRSAARQGALIVEAVGSESDAG